jgi:four helix bundle protein
MALTEVMTLQRPIPKLDGNISAFLSESTQVNHLFTHAVKPFHFFSNMGQYPMPFINDPCTCAEDSAPGNLKILECGTAAGIDALDVLLGFPLKTNCSDDGCEPENNRFIKLTSIDDLLRYIFDKYEKCYQTVPTQDQLKRAALSISNNIAEGFEYNNNPDFIKFLRYSKGSCGECRSMIAFIRSKNWIDSEKYLYFYNELKLLSSQIGSFMSYLKQHKSK